MYKTLIIMFVFGTSFCQDGTDNFITSGRIIRDRCDDNDPRPVCGGDGRTYQNRCYARRASVEIAYDGECVNCEECTGEHAPVCGNDRKVYINSCWADCKGVLVIATGECPDECNCDDTVDLVCALDGNTYRNSCLALCQGQEIDYLGQCKRNCSQCDYTLYDPVCGEDKRLYKNECQARCHNLRIAKDWWCDGAFHRLPY